MKLSPLPVASPVLREPLILIEPVLEKNSECSESASTTKPVIVSLVTHPYKPPLVEKRNQGVGRIFSSTFLTIFLAEIGDKTQLATLLISAQSHSPWTVFAGAAAALIATSLLGVLLGCWLANRLSPKRLETAAGTLLLFISVMLLWDVVHF